MLHISLGFAFTFQFLYYNFCCNILVFLHFVQINVYINKAFVAIPSELLNGEVAVLSG